MKEITDRKGATIYSRAAIRPNSYNEAERTFRVTFATETPVYRKRYDIDEPFNEVLSCTPEHIRLERANAGLPLFNNHNTGGVFTVFGKVTDIRIDNKELSGLVKLGARADEALIADIKNGILSGVSVGYNVYKYERTAPRKGEIAIYKAIDWEPMEISLAPVQADINSKIRGIDVNVQSPDIEENNFYTDYDNFHARMKEKERREYIAAEADKLLEKIHGERNPQNNNLNLNKMSILKKREAAEASILHRVDPNVFTETGGEFRPMSLLEIGKELLRSAGVNISGMSQDKLVHTLLCSRDMSTSDFPILLENIANKILRSQYELAPEYWDKIARQTNVTNFKEQRLYQIGSSNSMKEIPEGEELKYSKLTEAKQSIKVKTYGEGILFTRQMLINDDLGAFEAIPSKFLRDWNLFRGDLVWGMITDNVPMSDGKPLFDASHNNLGTASGIDEAGLTAALLAFRTQKDIDGKTPIRAVPKYLIVGPELEIEARKMLTTIIAGTTGDVNVFSTMGIELIVESRIPGKSWYLSALPQAIDGLYYAYLEGEETLRANRSESFDTDGLKLAVRGEFGVAAVDYRGWYKNPGA